MRKRTEDTPTMLYKYPGPHKIHGDKFDFVIVPRKDVEAKLANGWSRTTVEAKTLVETRRAEAKAAEEKAAAEAKAAEEKAAAEAKAAEAKANAGKSGNK